MPGPWFIIELLQDLSYNIVSNGKGLIRYYRFESFYRLCPFDRVVYIGQSNSGTGTGFGVRVLFWTFDITLFLYGVVAADSFPSIIW